VGASLLQAVYLLSVDDARVQRLRVCVHVRGTINAMIPEATDCFAVHSNTQQAGSHQ